MKSSTADANPTALVIVGCSAGGIDAVTQLLHALDGPGRPPVVVVQHVRPAARPTLAEYFASRFGPHVIEPEDKQPLAGGQIAFAPADHHLLIGEDLCYHLSVEDPVCFARPSVDVTLVSAADVFGPRLTGVILTGANGDGAAGLAHVAARGGRAIVQSPTEAAHSAMPAAALRACPGAEALELWAIGQVFASLTFGGLA